MSYYNFWWVYLLLFGRKRKTFIPFISFNCHFSILRHLMLNSFMSRVGSLLKVCHFSSQSFTRFVSTFDKGNKAWIEKIKNNTRGWLNNKQWTRRTCLIDLREQSAVEWCWQHFEDVKILSEVLLSLSFVWKKLKNLIFFNKSLFKSF